jgi:NTE family protein
MWEVMHRQKDIQYSSRVATHIARQLQSHRLRHVIKELLAYIPEDVRDTEEVRKLAGWGCLTRMHVVRLLAPRLPNEDHTKDVDFSPSGIRRRWEAGYADTLRAIERKAWQGEFDPLEGVILHEAAEDGATGRDAGRMAMPIEPSSRHKANGGLPHRLRGASR